MFSVLLFLKLRKWTIGISWIFFCSWIAVQSLVGLFFKKRFSYLYMAVLDLPCCLRTLSCSRQGLLFIGVCVLLIVVAFHSWPMNQFPWYINLPVSSSLPTLHQDSEMHISGKPGSCSPPEIIMFVKFLSIPSCPIY